METKEINRPVRNKISFISFMILEFAEAFKMNKPAAYQYLKQYGGLDFLFKHWWAMHTDDRYYGLRDLYEVCRKNGGLR
ncbi:MAG: DUF3791 domain-containing protein [Dysgonamonadaceae bacterium]|jgi:hypothetical protein|nr:DUF3791 domain-containing protein [Dysgonamonadaceae bacterium]